MTTLSTTAHGYERLLELSRNLTRGIDAPLPAMAARSRRSIGLAERLAALGERWAHARSAEAWRELARHDQAMAQDLRSALLRAR